MELLLIFVIKLFPFSDLIEADKIDKSKHHNNHN
jgi:hypothetical protein